MKLYSLILFTFIALVGFKQENTDDRIYWTKEKKLTWEDFKAIPDANSKDGAITNSGYTAPWKSKHDSIIISVVCFFNKNKSWVKNDSKTASMLKHEQCHFDITELYARKFMKLISTYAFNKSTFKETYNQLYNKSVAEWSSYQDLYDKETEHSKITAKQMEWEKKVAKELKSLESFSVKATTLYVGK